jgi:uncharacterized linocin/CFP29 family protein
MDFILNGQAHGSVANMLMRHDFDVGGLRPYVGPNGRSFVTLQKNGSRIAVPVHNVATLRRDDWKIIDDAVVKAAKPRLKAVADLRSQGLQFVIPNGMGKTVLETATQSDVDAASVSMEGLVQGQNDRPLFGLTNLPLPIIHKDFFLSLRQLQASRNGGSPLDTTIAELSARRVAEEAEKLLLGVSTVADQYAFGGGTIYGLTDHPNRNTKTMTAPTASGWAPATTVQEVLEMRLQLQNDNHFGPYRIYCSKAWDVYLDDDYSSAKGDLTLRGRLRQISEIQDVVTLDYLDEAGTAYVMIVVQMTSDVVRMVIGMEITTVQWETMGGMQLNFKIMAIMVPQVRVDYGNSSGIVHGTTA